MRRPIAPAFTPHAGKLLSHPQQLISLRERTRHTVINTHVSLTGACNLNCDYCAYRGRDRRQEIRLPVLMDYVKKLASRGLRAVTLTGGGEPTLHPDFNEIVTRVKSMGLEVGLITNGTQSSRVRCWDHFSWVRVSINVFDGWREKIHVPQDRMDKRATLGASFVHTEQTAWTATRVHALAVEMGCDYLRLAADFRGNLRERERQMQKLRDAFPDEADPIRTAISQSPQRAPQCDACLVPYIRPCLSEIGGGRVYACWKRSLPASGHVGLCGPHDVLQMLDAPPPPIVPRRDCKDCMCADTVEALAAWMDGKPKSHDLFV